jgi:hypothetical protein
MFRYEIVAVLNYFYWCVIFLCNYAYLEGRKLGLQEHHSVCVRMYAPMLT